MEFRARAEAWEGEATCGEAFDCGGIYVKAIALIVGALIPRQAQPFEVAHQGFGGGMVARTWVEVLDSQDHAPVDAAGAKPCHEQGEYVAQVHAARWGGRKATDDRWGVERRALLGRGV